MTESDWLAACDPVPMIEHLGNRISERKRRLFAVACCRRVWHILSADDRCAVEAAEQYADGRIDLEALGKVFAGCVERATGPSDSSSFVRFAQFAACDACARECDLVTVTESIRSAVSSERVTSTTGVDPILGGMSGAVDAAQEEHARTKEAAFRARWQGRGQGLKALVTGGLSAYQQTATRSRSRLAQAQAAETAAKNAVQTAIQQLKAVVKANKAEQNNTGSARTQEQSAQADLLREIVGNPFRSVAVDPTWLHGNGDIVAALAQGIDEERAFEHVPILADALEEAGCTDTAILEHCRGPRPHVRGCWVIDLLLDKR